MHTILPRSDAPRESATKRSGRSQARTPSDKGIDVVGVGWDHLPIEPLGFGPPAPPVVFDRSLERSPHRGATVVDHTERRLRPRRRQVRMAAGKSSQTPVALPIVGPTAHPYWGVGG